MFSVVLPCYFLFVNIVQSGVGVGVVGTGVFGAGEVGTGVIGARVVGAVVGAIVVTVGFVVGLLKSMEFEHTVGNLCRERFLLFKVGATVSVG